LFTKRECSLCLPVKVLINQVRKSKRFLYEEIDIEQYTEWYEKYRNHIPVVHVNHREIARHRLDEDTLRRALI